MSAAGHSISHAAVNDYERGEARVPAEYVAAVARAFDLSPAWLLTGEGEMHPVEPGAKDSAFDLIAEVVDATRAGGGQDQHEDRHAIYREAANKLREIAAKTNASNERAGSRKAS